MEYMESVKKLEEKMISNGKRNVEVLSKRTLICFATDGSVNL